MNGLKGKPTEYPENALVPYPVILAASKGDPNAMKIVLQHFSGYIASLSMRTTELRSAEPAGISDRKSFFPPGRREYIVGDREK